jgi:hypothetical protein
MESLREGSSGALDSNAWQMTAVANEVDGQFQAGAGLAFDEHPRPGTGRGAGPVGARLEARQAASGSTAEIDFTYGKKTRTMVSILKNMVESRLAAGKFSAEAEEKRFKSW